ncbi:MAG: MASE3 domain-containing protein [Thermodesulfobacteriota bacterium]
MADSGGTEAASPRPLLSRASITLLVLTTIALCGTSLYSFLLFHSLAELFSIVVAFGIFIVAWNTRQVLESNYLLFLGIAYLFIGGLDLVHTLAYKGMGIFDGYGANLPTQLWIAARYLEGFSLLAAPFRIEKRCGAPRLIAGFSAVFLLALAAIFFGLFPDCFLEGSGLTPFKKNSEYLICLLLLGALAALARKRSAFDRPIFRIITASILFTMGSELAFTFYVSVYGLSNLIGHVFKFVSFYLIYKALIETGLARPYQLLFREVSRREAQFQAGERKYRSLFDNMQNGFAYQRIILNDQGVPADWVFLEVNSAFERLTGLRQEDVVGRRVTEVLPGIEQDPADWIGRFGQVALTGQPVQFESYARLLQKWFSVSAFSPQEGLFAVTFSDISASKQAEAALARAHEQSEADRQRLEAILETTPVAVVLIEAATGRLSYINRRAAEIYGTDSSELDLATHLAAVQALRADGTPYSPEDLPVSQALRGERVYNEEMTIQRADGVRVPVAANAAPLRDARGNVAAAVVVFDDITERKKAVEAIKASLHEKEVLLKEVHHRVKNNLQVISSLVSLQADEAADEAVRAGLADVTNRVRSMALVHEKVYQSTELGRIDFADYLRSLLGYLWRAHGADEAHVSLRLDLTPVLLPVVTAVPCGLIVNELAGNALKHAFVGRAAGEVLVSFQEIDGRISLFVQDDGVGLPAGFDWQQARSLGLRLVHMLAGQLRAEVEILANGGTAFRIRFQRAEEDGETRRL